MELKIKPFDALTTAELYALLQARVAVFVVEQQCPYQDLDGLDARSLHVFYEEDGRVLAYLRAFEKDAQTVQLGRVLTVERGKGLGGKLLRAGLAAVLAQMQPRQIYLEAQTYAVGFYAREGFRVCSEEFLEDGIPHVGMLLKAEDFSV